MKKFLLSVVAALFVVGCASTDLAPQADYIAELERTLNQYNDVCGDYVFKEARAYLEDAKEYRRDGFVGQSEVAYNQAKNFYEEGLAEYNMARGSMDRYVAEINDQNSRVYALRSDAAMYAPKEYADASARIDALHAEAENRLRMCDLAGAQRALDEAERELRYLEDITYIRMNATQPVTSANSEVYIVKRGDSLWRIAANKYSNPYFWPLIYWSNKSQIKDPDLIYPDQRFTIDYDYDSASRAEAERHAKTRGPWSLYDNK